MVELPIYSRYMTILLYHNINEKVILLHTIVAG